MVMAVIIVVISVGESYILRYIKAIDFDFEDLEVQIAETRIERVELCKPENSLSASVLNVQYIQLG